MIVANRTRERGEVLAREFNAEAISLNQIPEALVRSDIVISSTAAPLPILGKGMAERALKQRRHRPRSEEHTSELQSRGHLVCRLLLEKKNPPITTQRIPRKVSVSIERTMAAFSVSFSTAPAYPAGIGLSLMDTTVRAMPRRGTLTLRI